MPCGNCKHFDENETWGGKGYCEYHKTYYYPDDNTCSHYDKREDGGGCYMTTACCEYRGLADDCRELTAMRRLRDDYVRHVRDGHRAIAEYYHMAPDIIRRIDASARRGALYDYIYGVVSRCADLVDEGCYAGAAELYREMVDRLRKKLG